MSKEKAYRVKCPACSQMILTYFSMIQKEDCLRGHCKPGTDPKKSIGVDCDGSYTPVAKALASK